ncbi:hypothetical protein [Rugosimonospora africana]|uniref:Uncharacterized protein n=1 Tax=Rugosimonospora africana TaxID=556532 RepID=A0A8J3QV67_9ACTN|nr:hypothetical protein [Rugosimonospora africana]GIH16627.1 hypothetical protein Raf01_47990 [Rugosimonospora africana]
MTAATVEDRGPGRAWVAGAARLMRIELRRNAMIWMLPVAGVLFWALTYRRSMALAPLWNVRAMTMQSTTIAVFIPTVTGVAAWTGTREARRRLTDLLSVTSRSRWRRQLASWAATTAWALGCYLACVGVLYGVTATQATGSGPPWWPVLVGAASVPALAALGFTAGTVLPSRYTPPLVAMGAFLMFEAGLELVHGAGSPWQISPLVTGPYQLGDYEGLATFYPYLPDLPIAQVIFLVGLTLALLGILGLPSLAGGRWPRLVAAALTVTGVLSAATATALAGTGRLDPHGMIAIPALHNAADDRPVAYTPVCSHTAIPVCLHPAYRAYLGAVSTDLAPLLDELAGVPGAPARIAQTTTTYRWTDDGIDIATSAWTMHGTPPVYTIVLPNQAGEPALSVDQSANRVKGRIARDLVTAVVGGGSDPAQQAVTAGVLKGVRPVLGSEPPDLGRRITPNTPAAVAAQRFAALPVGTRHAWLVVHAADLKAGRITLDQLP